MFKVLALIHIIGKQRDIIGVTIRFDNANGKERRKDKLIMGCERSSGMYISKISEVLIYIYRKFQIISTFYLCFSKKKCNFPQIIDKYSKFRVRANIF